MWGFPWLTRLAILAMVAIVAAMSVIPDQRAALLFGVISAVTLVAIYGLRRLGLRLGLLRLAR